MVLVSYLLLNEYGSVKTNSLAIPIFEVGVCSRGYLISPL